MAVQRGDILYRGASAWLRLPPGTDGDVLTTHSTGADPTWETPAGGPGGPTILSVMATSDESVSNDTLQDDDELILAVSANTNYILTGLLMFTTGTSTTPDVKMTFTFPAAATLNLSRHSYQTSGTDTATMSLAQRYGASSGYTAIGSGVISTGTTNGEFSPIWLNGTLIVGANSGNLTLQWAQNTSTGGTPTVRELGSYLRLEEV